MYRCRAIGQTKKSTTFKEECFSLPQQLSIDNGTSVGGKAWRSHCIYAGIFLSLVLHRPCAGLPYLCEFMSVAAISCSEYFTMLLPIVQVLHSLLLLLLFLLVLVLVFYVYECFPAWMDVHHMHAWYYESRKSPH